jgi:hypothetical protein
MPIFSTDPTVNRIAQPYSAAFKDACFFAWYNAGKPTIRSFALEIVPIDEYGNKPHLETIKDWYSIFEWAKRANMLDEQVMQQIESQAVEERVKMLRRHADVGMKLVEKGLEHLEHTDKFEKDADAIRAIIQGAELERASLGLPTAMIDVAKMKDEDLSSVINKLLGRVSADEAQKIVEDIVEGEIVEHAPDDTEA